MYEYRILCDKFNKKNTFFYSYIYIIFLSVFRAPAVTTVADTRCINAI